MELKTLQLSSQSISYYESDGQGPVIVFVHGNSLSSKSFKRQFESPLARNYRLLAIDLPGHGRSERAKNPGSIYTLPGYAAVVAEFSEKLGLDDAVFVGASLGGHALLEALPNLKAVSGLFIFGAPPLPLPCNTDDAFLPKGDELSFVFNPEVSDEEVEVFVSHLYRAETQDRSVADSQDICKTDGMARAVLGQSFMAGAYTDEVKAVADMTIPLAIIHGDEERLVNGSYYDAINTPTLWRAEVQTIAGAGHSPQWETPAEFNRLLDEFAQDTLG